MSREQAATFAAAYRCPDCLSEQQLTELNAGVYELRVMHDRSCPFFRGRHQ